jgi:hypothetical protein
LKSIRSRLSYANVVSTFALFLVLGGGAAVAATELRPNSVGTAQLKAQTVTGAKIKSGAVIGSKIADGAVDTGKLAGGAVTSDRIADGAVTTGKIANGSVTADKLAIPLPTPAPTSQIVARMRGTAAVEFPRATNPPQPQVQYPRDELTYIQPAGEDDLYLATFEATFPASCAGRQRASASLFIDAPEDADGRQFVGAGEIDTNISGGATVTGYFSLGGSTSRGFSLAPASPTKQAFSVNLQAATCAGVKMTAVKIDVIGTR